MPTFIITTTVEKHNKKYGDSDILVRIYKLLKTTERPLYITNCRFNTSSTPGALSEAFRHLIDIGEIPKKYYNYSKCDWRGAGYYCTEVEEAGYRIYEVY